MEFHVFCAPYVMSCHWTLLRRTWFPLLCLPPPPHQVLIKTKIHDPTFPAVSAPPCSEDAPVLSSSLWSFDGIAPVSAWTQHSSCGPTSTALRDGITLPTLTCWQHWWCNPGYCWLPLPEGCIAGSWAPLVFGQIAFVAASFHFYISSWSRWNNGLVCFMSSSSCFCSKLYAATEPDYQAQQNLALVESNLDVGSRTHRQIPISRRMEKCSFWVTVYCVNYFSFLLS